MFLKSVESVFILIMLIASGWIMSRIGWINDDVKKFLNKFIVKVGVPALTISNFFESFSRELLISSVKFVSVSLLAMSALLVIAIPLAKVIRVEPIKSGSFVSMSVVSNSMFFGLPIALSLFGNTSIPYILFYYIANTLMFWGICSPMIARDGGVENKRFLENLKNVLNIPLITVIISGVLLYFNFSPPSIILKASKYFSSVVTPLASLVVGKIISDIDLKKFKFDKSIIVIIIIRFIISPIIMFTITRLVKLPNLSVQVLTIQAAMPVMMQTTIVSELYEADSKYVATALSITTLLSLFFIPFYMLIMEKLVF